jgi:hypothetical protein
MDDKELCNLACNPSLDGYTPNPLYSSGYCPDYMKRQCNADGSMFQEQWESHQENIKDHNARKLMAMSFHQRPVEYRHTNELVSSNPAANLPPTTSEVYRAMYANVPVHPAINTLPAKRKKKTKKTTSRRKKK